MATYLPAKQHDLVQWSAHFLASIQTAPETWGLQLAQVGAYSNLHTAYAELVSLTTSNETKTPSAVLAKRLAKKSLIDGVNGIRYLVNIIQAFPGTTDEMRKNIDITIRDEEHSSQPPPSVAPLLIVTAVAGRTVHFRLRDAENPTKRGKPVNIAGATLFTYVGEEQPAPNQWQFAANFTRTLDTIEFPVDVAAGAKVWLTAFWYNRKGQSSPPCVPVSTNVQGGNTQIQQLKLAA